MYHYNYILSCVITRSSFAGRRLARANKNMPRVSQLSDRVVTTRQMHRLRTTEVELADTPGVVVTSMHEHSKPIFQKRTKCNWITAACSVSLVSNAFLLGVIATLQGAAPPASPPPLAPLASQVLPVELARDDDGWDVHDLVSIHAVTANACRHPVTKAACEEHIVAMLGSHQIGGETALRRSVNAARRAYACRSFDASLSVHGRLFLQQQAAERAFVSALSGAVCGALPPAATSVSLVRLRAYQGAVHNALRPLRAAINRHVHGAFFFKAACYTLYKEVLYAQIEQRSGADVPPARAAHALHPILSTPEPAFCSLPILRHERYNLAEGDMVAQIGAQLLAGGPQLLCDDANVPLSRSAAPSFLEQAPLESVLRYHRSDRSFDEVQELFSPFCAAAEADAAADVGGAAQAALEIPQRSFDEALEVHVHATLPHPSHKPSFTPRPSRSQASVWEPCEPTGGPQSGWAMSVPLLISIFGNDTLFLIGEAKRALLDELSVCIDEQTEGEPSAGSDAPGAPLPARDHARWRHVSEAPGFDELLSLSAEADARRGRFYGHNSWGFGMLTDLTLATVYHKLVPLCGPVYIDETHEWTGDAPGITQCTRLDGTSTDARVFELVTSTELSKCNGPDCLAAAAAVQQLRSFLKLLTTLRTRMVQAWWNTTADGANVSFRVNPNFLPAAGYLDYLAPNTRVPSCSTQHALLSEAVVGIRQLPATLARLRRSAPALEAQCVVPPRRATLNARDSAGAIGSLAREAIAELTALRHESFKSNGNIRFRIGTSDPAPPSSGARARAA